MALEETVKADLHTAAPYLIAGGAALVVFGPSPDGKTFGIGEAALLGYRLEASDIAWYLSSPWVILGFFLIVLGLIGHFLP